MLSLGSQSLCLVDINKKQGGKRNLRVYLYLESASINKWESQQKASMREPPPTLAGSLMPLNK